MTTLYTLKPRFVNLLRPLAYRLAAAGATANQVTLAAAFLSVVTGAGIALCAPDHAALLLVLPPVLLVRMALNALDGVMARELGQASRLGAQLNELGDVVSDIALILPFAVLPGSSPFAVVAFALAAALAELAGVLGAAHGGRRTYHGPFGKSDRAMALAVLAVVLGAGIAVPLGFLFLVMAALSLATVVKRVRANLDATPLLI